MSFSLYGALPPSKSEKDADKPETTSTTKPSGLYASLGSPDVGSDPLPDKKETEVTSATTTFSTATPSQPTGTGKSKT